MGDITVPWKESEKCDVCGCFGAWDFMGDLICQKCLTEAEIIMPDENSPPTVSGEP